MYVPSEDRYNAMPHNRLGVSRLKLPSVSLGLWHNFGNTGRFDNIQKMHFTAEELAHIDRVSLGTV